MSLLFMCIKQKDYFLNKNYTSGVQVKVLIDWLILIILVVFYESLSLFILLPGSGSTFPEVDPYPAKWYGSETLMKTTTNFILTNCSQVKDFLQFQKITDYS